MYQYIFYSEVIPTKFVFSISFIQIDIPFEFKKTLGIMGLYKSF